MSVNAAAGVVPGWPAGPDVVHLVVRLGPGVGRWGTRCPADVEGLSSTSDQPRTVVPVLRLITCPACRSADEDLSIGVDVMTRAGMRQRDDVAGDVLSFLRYIREELGVVLADYAGSVQLKAYPSGHDITFVRKWLQQRDPY